MEMSKLMKDKVKYAEFLKCIEKMKKTAPDMVADNEAAEL